MAEKRTSRNPVDRLNGYDSREAMWLIIRKLKTFTVRQLQQDTTLEISTVRDYVTGLVNGGFLEKVVTGPRETATLFDLVRDVGIDAPRVRKDGTIVTQGQGHTNMWRTMKILKVFSAKELAITASTPTAKVKVSTAEDYVKHLCHAGYLVRLRDGKYRLLQNMYTGPKAPMIQRVKRVFDQNLKKVMWREDGGKQ